MNHDGWRDALKRLRAIAQTGQTYTKDPYDLERYQELETLSLKLLAALLDCAPEALRSVYLPERGYPTPKIDVRAGVFEDDRILLVRETADGRWTLPGGWGDEHESPRESIEREVREESGFEVRAERLVAVKDRHLHPYTPKRLERIYKLFFLCGPAGGEARTSLETDAVGFFAVDDLPPLSLGRTLAADVELLAAYRQAPERACYFD
ncbi:MAG: NUDIX hydrolase N-terminal domain-containing protein [Pseudomonadales bacterium]|jgi:ADP-ribose pyrophosphatase YjhB (NUDIX family)